MSDSTYARAAWTALVAAASLIAVATWWILARDAGLAGAAVAAAGVLLLLGAALSRRSPRDQRLRLWRFVDSAVDRLFDGALLGSVAWTTRGSDATTSAGALVALGSGYLGAYVRARGAALGYAVEESVVTRALRYGLLACGLLLGWLEWTVWTIGVVSAAAAVVRSSQVAKEERA
jgi:hypothetical protein